MQRLLNAEDTASAVDTRDNFTRDRDRILFCRSFRRLSFKTQVIPIISTLSEHIRTRLTHSFEVMQIASSIVNSINKRGILKQSLSLPATEAVALGHDLGHAPFGHTSERLMYSFLFHDRFDGLENKYRHSFHSLKVVSFLEKHYLPDFFGLNLMIGTMDGILKHSSITEGEMEMYSMIYGAYGKDFHGSKFRSESVETIFRDRAPLMMESAIVAYADEVAQMCHDVEDMRRVGDASLVKNFFTDVSKMFRALPRQMDSTSGDYGDIEPLIKKFEDAFDKYDEYPKLVERCFVNLAISVAVMVIIKVVAEGEQRQNNINGVIPTYQGIIDYSLDKDTRVLAKQLNTAHKLYEDLLYTSQLNLRFELKQRELIKRFCFFLNDALNSFSDENRLEKFVTLLRGRSETFLKHSFNTGLRLKNDQAFVRLMEQRGALIDDNFPYRLMILDYLFSLSDRYLVSEYQDLTFESNTPFP